MTNKTKYLFTGLAFGAIGIGIGPIIIATHIGLLLIPQFAAIAAEFYYLYLMVTARD